MKGLHFFCQGKYKLLCFACCFYVVFIAYFIFTFIIILIILRNLILFYYSTRWYFGRQLNNSHCQCSYKIYIMTFFTVVILWNLFCLRVYKCFFFTNSNITRRFIADKYEIYKKKEKKEKINNNNNIVSCFYFFCCSSCFII